MGRVVEAVGVHEMGVAKAQGRRLGVHPLREGLHGPGGMDGEGHGGVVAALHYEAVEQVP